MKSLTPLEIKVYETADAAARGHNALVRKWLKVEVK